MKKLLIALTVLGSASSFGTELYKINVETNTLHACELNIQFKLEELLTNKREIVAADVTCKKDEERDIYRGGILIIKH
ncbi:MAG: hypothetical protein KA715_10255 [Xanthomonadaceae bacterium]|nr:hypothetical protein [Xanthomonadaceae bacterium]